MFTLTFVDICFANSHPFGFTSRIKETPFDILKFLVTILSYQDKKVLLILVYKYGALIRSSEFIMTCHSMNAVFKTTCGDTYSLNSKIENPNKTLAGITRTLLLNLSHKK